jgi:hypothetical protein
MRRWCKRAYTYTKRVQSRTHGQSASVSLCPPLSLARGAISTGAQQTHLGALGSVEQPRSPQPKRQCQTGKHPSWPATPPPTPLRPQGSPLPRPHPCSQLLLPRHSPSPLPPCCPHAQRFSPRVNCARKERRPQRPTSPCCSSAIGLTRARCFCCSLLPFSESAPCGRSPLDARLDKCVSQADKVRAGSREQSAVKGRTSERATVTVSERGVVGAREEGTRSV